MAESYRGTTLTHDLVNAETGEVAAEAGTKLTPRALRKLEEAGLSFIVAEDSEVIGRFVANDIVDMSSGVVLAEAGDEISEEMLNLFASNDITSFDVLGIDNVNVGPHLRNTLASDRNNSRAEALVDIYRVMRPGERKHWKAHTSYLPACSLMPRNMTFLRLAGQDERASGSGYTG